MHLITKGFVIIIKIIYFEEHYYIDKYMPMGRSLSLKNLQHFFIEPLQKRTGLETLDHYLDDFFFAGQDSTNGYQMLMSLFQELWVKFGIPLAEDKTKGPTITIIFLGLEIDTVLLKESLLLFIPKKRIALKELESLTGLMAICSRAIVSARAFIRRFYDLIASVRKEKPHYTVRLNQEVKSDAWVWIEFLAKFNRQCYIPEYFGSTNEAIKLFTDSNCMQC